MFASTEAMSDLGAIAPDLLFDDEESIISSTMDYHHSETTANKLEHSQNLLQQPFFGRQLSASDEQKLNVMLGSSSYCTSTPNSFPKRETTNDFLSSLFSNNSELDLTPCNPSDITGQRLPLEYRMEMDKKQILRQNSIPQPSDHEKHLSVDQTQNYIEKLEEFISALEKQDTSAEIAEIKNELENEVTAAEYKEERMEAYEQPAAANPIVEYFWDENVESEDGSKCPVANSKLTDAETSAAERMLDALIKGRLTTTTEEKEQVDCYTNSENGCIPLSPQLHQQQIVTTDDGTYIIIVMEPQASSSADLVDVIQESNEDKDVRIDDDDDEGTFPAMSWQNEDEDSDSEWTPDSPCPATKSRRRTTSASKPADQTSRLRALSSFQQQHRKPGRKLEQRAANGRVIKKSQMIKNKKERKKLQNVEAARRYRDKKKNELQVLEEEEKRQSEKNKVLKRRFAEIDGELKTLKKMLVELGYVKSG